MSAAPSISGRDIAAMRRALASFESFGASLEKNDPRWLVDAMSAPSWLVVDFVEIVLTHGGRCVISSGRFAETWVHSAGLLRPFLPGRGPVGMGYVDADLLNRFFAERGGVS